MWILKTYNDAKEDEEERNNYDLEQMPMDDFFLTHTMST